jgi:hypothetical protein
MIPLMGIKENTALAGEKQRRMGRHELKTGGIWKCAYK